MRVAVVILNYNSSNDCRKCVSFLKRQEGVKLELVLVDNCSPDGDKVKTLCEEEGCTFIASKENRGYNAGNNIGLRYAASKGYKYALIANPDMEFPQTDYVKKLVTIMERNHEIVVLGSDIVTPEGIHQNPKYRGESDWRKSFNWFFELFCRQKRKEQTPVWVVNPQISQYCKCLNGCCFLISIPFVQQLNFFDEETFLYGEEPILGRQVELAGKQMFYTPETFAVHHHLKSKEGSRAFCFKHWKHSQLLYVRKYSGLSLWGKSVSYFSIHCYFAALKVYHWLYSRNNR